MRLLRAYFTLVCDLVKDIDPNEPKQIKLRDLTTCGGPRQTRHLFNSIKVIHRIDNEGHLHLFGYAGYEGHTASRPFVHIMISLETELYIWLDPEQLPKTMKLVAHEIENILKEAAKIVEDDK